jgi:SAM-dependent methyltransferase
VSDDANGASEYALGTDADELHRLGFQHQLWAEQTTGAWARAGFAPDDVVLDLGCGPGYASFDLADLVGPGGQVLAVDRSPRFIEHVTVEANRRGADAVKAWVSDAEQLDLRPESINGAWARFVLCFVDSLATVVDNVARALAPGGVFAVLDYVRYEAFTLAPGAAVFDRVIRAASLSFRSNGGLFDVGQQLPTLMHRSGLVVEDIRPVARIARPGSALWHWLPTFFEPYLPRLVESGSVDEHDAAEFWAEWDRHSADPGAFLLTPPMAEIVSRKPDRS